MATNNSSQEQFEINDWIRGIIQQIENNYYSYEHLPNNGKPHNIPTEDLLSIKTGKIKKEITESFDKYKDQEYLAVKLKSLINTIGNTIQLKEEFPTIEIQNLRKDKRFFDESLLYLCDFITNIINEKNNSLEGTPKKERNPTFKGKPQKGIKRQDKLLLLCYLAEMGYFPKRKVDNIKYGIFLGLLTNESLDNMYADLEEYERVVKQKNYKHSQYNIRFKRIKEIMESIECEDVVKQMEKDFK